MIYYPHIIWKYLFDPKPLGNHLGILWSDLISLVGVNSLNYITRFTDFI